MIIIFYNASENSIYVCSETEKTKVVKLDDPNILDYIPNDDILYVQNAHFLNKKQFADWLKGEPTIIKQQENYSAYDHSGRFGMQNVEVEKSPQSKKLYIHPKHNGSVVIPDIHSQKYPNGLTLNGKYHFVAMDDIEDAIENSNNYRFALAKGKIEIVDGEYVKQNIHKQNKYVSPSEASLNAILVPAHIKAESVISGAYNHSPDIAQEILVEG